MERGLPPRIETKVTPQPLFAERGMVVVSAEPRDPLQRRTMGLLAPSPLATPKPPMNALARPIHLTISPPHLSQVVCHLSEMQAFWYKRLLLKDADAVQRLASSGGDSSAIAAALTTADGDAAVAPATADDGEGEGKARPKASGADWKRLQMLMAQLRKACNHPYLFDGAETTTDEGETDVQEMIQASGKLHVRYVQQLQWPRFPFPPKPDPNPGSWCLTPPRDHPTLRWTGQTLDRLLTRLQARGHRVVIFSQWTHTLDILDDFLYHRQVPVPALPARLCACLSACPWLPALRGRASAEPRWKRRNTCVHRSPAHGTRFVIRPHTVPLHAPGRGHQPHPPPDQHRAIQRPRFAALRLPHDDARRRPRRQPADGRCVRGWVARCCESI